MRQQAGIPARMHVTDQFGAAADLTQAQYAQVMAEYNAFQHRVKTSIVQVQSHVARLPGGGQVEMRHSFGVNTVRVVVMAPKLLAPTGNSKAIIVDADFIVIRYDYHPDDGSDLDTRTKLVNPIQSGNIGNGQGDGIGIDGSIYGPGDGGFAIGQHANELVATWGGDNYEYGAESVFINIKTIKSIHNNSPIIFECRAFWMRARRRGDCKLSVMVYKGGEIKFNEPNYEFFSVGGDLVANLEKKQNIAAVWLDGVVGDVVAVLSFDPSTNQLTLA